MAASLADEHTALFLDARSLHHERVPLPSGAELIVLHSGVSHGLADGDYNTRRAECEQASERLGVGLLRDLGVADLPRLDALPEVLRRRARHVITENERVLKTVQAFRADDLRGAGALFYASHDSMRLDYEVSVPEIDRIVNLARNAQDVFGARLTGGGFGGSVVMLVRRGAAGVTAQRIAERYAAQTGCRPRILVPL
jgi:galactokinase